MDDDDYQWATGKLADAVHDDRYAIDVAYTVLVDLAFAGHVLRGYIWTDIPGQWPSVRAAEVQSYDQQRADARDMEARNA